MALDKTKLKENKNSDSSCPEVTTLVKKKKKHINIP